MLRTTSSVALAGALILAPGVARADCQSDDECKGDRICSAGACTNPVACNATKPCGEGETCDGGVCRPATPAPAPLLGGEGESCQRGADCQAGLTCLEQVCRDPRYGRACSARADCGASLPCIDHVCGGPEARKATTPAPRPEPAPPPPPPAVVPPPPPPPPPPVEDDWSSFALEGVHGFVGLSFLPGGVGVATALSSGDTSDASYGLLFGLQGGVLIDRVEVSVELSPVTWYVEAIDEPILQLNFAAGGYLPITEALSWTLRGGIGLAAVNTPTELFQLRADLIGLAYQIGHVVLDVSLPSFRLLTDFDEAAVLAWQFGFGGRYVF